jgi:hypothetical protein
MRKQYLWVDKPGFFYDAAGNIDVSAGSKGTMFFWYHASLYAPSDQTVIMIRCANTDYIRVIHVNGVMKATCVSNAHALDTADFDLWTHYIYWIPCALIWDFTGGGAGDGTLKLYVAGDTTTCVATTAWAPRENANKIYIGPRTADTASANVCFDNVAIYDGVMTAAEYLSLRGSVTSVQTRKYARRRLPTTADVADGALTLLATFDGTYNADIGGDIDFNIEVSGAGLNQFCRLDDGSRAKGMRYRFFLGMPRHDDSDDDRVPLKAVLQSDIGFAPYNTTITDTDTHSQITVASYNSRDDGGQGVGWFNRWIQYGNGSMERPMTIRMRVNCPSATNVKNTPISLGPVCYIAGPEYGSWAGSWGTGTIGTAVTDGGNTTSVFLTDAMGYGDDNWNGCELFFKNGANFGYRVIVTDYDSVSGTFTIGGALPNIPVSTEAFCVDFKGRLIANKTSRAVPFDETSSIQVWMWESYTSGPLTDRPWQEIECIYGEGGSNNYVRYNRGQQVFMNLSTSRDDGTGRDMMFGRSVMYDSVTVVTDYTCDILLESIEVEGFPTYQEVSPQGSFLRDPQDLSDTFFALSAEYTQSTRAWIISNLTLNYSPPLTKYTPYADVQDSFDLPGSVTWRNTGYVANQLKPQTDVDKAILIYLGSTAGGIYQYGYLEGTWNDSTGLVDWIDETPLVDKSNPFLLATELTGWKTQDSTFGLNLLPGILHIFGCEDDTLVMTVGGNESNPDHYFTRLYTGAEDRWTWSRIANWSPHNPLPMGIAGIEKPMHDGSVGLWGNRECDWILEYNPYTLNKSRRFIGLTRLKTDVPTATLFSNNRRPLGAITTENFRGYNLLPHGNVLQALACYDVGSPIPHVMTGDVTAFYTTYMGSPPPVRLFATEDDVHFRTVIYEHITDASIGTSILLGDRLIHYIYDGAHSSALNQAIIIRNRETWYALTAGQTSGTFDTCIIVKPTNGWDKLYVNTVANEGTLTVSVLAPSTETVITGYDTTDCDAIADGVQSEVTWNGFGFNTLSATDIRLRFTLTRPAAGDDSPVLYAYHANGIQDLSPIPVDTTGHGLTLIDMGVII